MALNPETEYAGRIAASSTNYPYGSAVDETVAGANDGTPLLASLVNDTFGFQQALLEAVGATPTGNEDTAIASQYVDAIVELIERQVSWLGWFIADSFDTEQSADITAQDTAPTGVFFKPDGTKMYMIGGVSDTVYQYTLAVAWDLSTASYDSVSKSVTAQDTTPTDVFFSPDGLKMYMLGNANDTIYQYTLSTAWNVSTATYDAVSKSVTAQDTAPEGVFFKPDGTKMYVIGSTNDSVYQYTLATAWNVGTATYDAVSKSVATEDITVADVFFKPDGLKMYMLGGDRVYQYTLATAWNVGTATYDSVFKVVTPGAVAVRGFFFDSDGTKMYVAKDGSSILQYSTGKPYKGS